MTSTSARCGFAVISVFFVMASAGAGEKHRPELGAVEVQRLCWRLDGAMGMADFGAQLEQSHELSLEKQRKGSPDGLPAKVEERLSASLRQVRTFRQWVSRTTSALGRLFTGEEVDTAIADLQVLLDQSAAPAHGDDWQALLSPDSWSSQCGEDDSLAGVIALSLWAAVDNLRAELRRAESRLAEQALLVFEARARRATAAGEVAALEAHLAIGANESFEPRKETLAGVFNASRRADRILWKAEPLRKQVNLVLARTLEQQAQDDFVHEENLTKEDQVDAARKRLRITDRALLEATRTLEGLAETRDDLGEKLRNHVKSVLAQCWPRNATVAAPRSRYTRFDLASPAANAVQLSLQVGDFLEHSVTLTLPALRDVALEAIQDVRSGAGRTFSTAPEMSRWWEWTSSPSKREDVFLSFDGFKERYTSALESYDADLTHGGRLVALHSLWNRWKDVEFPIFLSGPIA